jgi:hypothetical protein
MSVTARRRSATRLVILAAVVAAPAALADVVQGVITPANAQVVIRDASNNEVEKVPGGPFQLWLPVGSYVAECVSPNAGRKIPIESLAQPTSVNINCG